MDPAVLSLIGVLLALALLIVLAYKGAPLLFIAPFMSMIIMVFSRVDLLETLTGAYMSGFANFAKSNYLIFFFSAVFGKMMGDCNAAKVIAYKCATLVKKFPGKEKFLAVFALILINGLLTMGGISLFVVVFTMVTIAKNLFEELDVPWSMYTCSTLSSGVLTMTMIPGSPSIQNLIPTQYLGTTPTAAPVLGTILAVIALAIGLCYVQFQLKRAAKNGVGFLPSGAEIAKVEFETEAVPDHPLWKCLAPCIVLLVVMNVIGVAPVFSLIWAIAATYVLFRKEFKSIKKTISEGGSNAVGAIANVCAVVGFGSTVAAVPAYGLVLGALDKIPGPPIVQLIIAVNLAAGVTGSASGGLGIALESLSERFLNMGLNPQVIHRMASVSCGGLDSLPHNGAVINTLTVTKLGHKYGYGNYCFMTVVIPLICCVIGGVLATIGVV